MAEMSIDQKTIFQLLSNKRSNFLIPDYQRPYAWTDVECKRLWDDLFEFAIPGENANAFDGEEYFLGPIVTFQNNNYLEVIDGQQRLTSILLLLRAFYDRFEFMVDDNSVDTRKMIGQCVWQTNEFGRPNMDALKITSEVATDSDKEVFLNILKTGHVGDKKDSNYAKNFAFFQERIDWFLNRYPTYFAFLPIRILNNCVLLPIEAKTQETALRIFSTLNDRGMPLSDSDIFKAQFYKYYSSIGEKDYFIARWRELEELSEQIFHPLFGTPMDELFSRYMYYERSLKGVKLSTTEALRRFYEKDSYALLKKKETLENLTQVADFWKDVSNQSSERFSPRILRLLFVLNYAPNSMWTYFTSVYFMHNKDDNDLLDDEKFYVFLNKMIAFIWAYAITNPGVSALRTPIYAEMVNIVQDQPITFQGFLFDEENLRTALNNYNFGNSRPATRAMLAWWAFQDEEQELITPIETVLQVEHIYAKNRVDKDAKLSNKKNIEKLGNKSLLEKRINIRASDYRFEDKKKHYCGYKTSRQIQVKPTAIHELIVLSKKDDFTESDILTRNDEIFEAFIDFMKKNDLILHS